MKARKNQGHSGELRCEAVLAGVARALPGKMQNMPKTKKRPTRAYGGVLCTKCTRKKITQKARK